MDRKYSSSSQFDPRRYEGYLSLFGRKVLDSMLKKWNAGKKPFLVYSLINVTYLPTAIKLRPMNYVGSYHHHHYNQSE